MNCSQSLQRSILVWLATGAYTFSERRRHAAYPSWPHFDTQEALFDTAWSECNEHQLAGGCGDGSVLLWDIRARERATDSALG